MQEFFSPDGSLRAQVMRRDDGMYQVAFAQRQKREDAPTWEPIPGLSVLPGLEEALAFAAQHVGLDRDVFDDE